MPKIKLGKNVLDAAQERTEFAFDSFKRVYASFSGGKDSTVMLHIAADEARKRGRKLGVLFVDLEGQYKLTIDHIRACIEKYSDVIDLHWVCLPIHLRNAVSVYQPFWKCWDTEAEEQWIRLMPEEAISDQDRYPFFSNGMEFEEFVPQFGEWYAQGESCCCLVGIRCDESLNRFRTIASSKKVTLDGKQWTTQVTDNCYNVYPIYDWNGSDIWVYHAKFPDKPHNKLYDYMHRAGVPLGNMRICQPYGDDQRRGLWLYHLIEPETWARAVARVNGANGGALYMQDWGNINGYRKITKPLDITWKQFCELFLAGLPPSAQEHYENKIILYQRWHKERGYPDGIPDAAPYELEQARRAPSWRRIAKTLLRNDYWCKGIGFTQHKSSGYLKYLDLMRRRKAAWAAEAA